MTWRLGIGYAVAVVCLAQAAGAAPAAAPKNPDAVNVGGSWRVRAEVWDWFNADSGEDEYSYYGSLLRLGFSNANAKRDWMLELAQPTLIGLPSDAIAPAPQGQLGLGGAYFAANGGQDASLFIKQGFVRLRQGLGPGNQLRLGRFEFVDGAEVVPSDPSLAWVKRERVAHRLLGTFAWSHVGRSFDGGQLSHNGKRLNLTFLAARPTEGVFQLDGWQNIPVRVLYGAATLSTPGKMDARIFALNYRDDRGLVKTDNRPAAVRAADQDEIDLNTFGGHYLRLMPMGGGKLDLLLWGAVQTGDWGPQDHQAHAWTAEVGYQPKSTGLKPWLRAGYYVGSGDDNPADGDHETFFQVLPTPRIYARMPFFNGMNLKDGFAQAILRPGKRWTLRADAHRLHLTEGVDLWYQGGGAFQREGFGYAGRPGNGESDFATLLDLSADYALNPETTLSLYIATARGGDVIERIYPRGKNATFGYVEFTRRW
jgi:hypothetical protein